MNKLAAVVAHFNPAGYQSRRENLRATVANLSAVVPVYVGEVVYGDDAESFTTVAKTSEWWRPEGPILWQKERILNLLIDDLPDQYEYVAWIDGDILFTDPEWPAKTVDALQRTPIVQPWSYLEWLGEYRPPVRSVGIRGKLGHCGFAWAARRDFLNSIGGLFDFGICGGGDVCMSDQIVFHERTKRIPPTLRRLADQWGERARKHTTTIGAIEGTIRHQYHGTRENRQYQEREQQLLRIGFLPERHIEHDEGGLWRWTDAAPDRLREFVRNYFFTRKEDDQCRMTNP